jgi:hypothetical protein
MARAPASALPARPSFFTVALLVGIAGIVDARAHGNREGGAPPVVLALVLVGVVHRGCRRPGSRRCCSPFDLGRWVQASLLNARPGECPAADYRVVFIPDCLSQATVARVALSAGVARKSLGGAAPLRKARARAPRDPSARRERAARDRPESRAADGAVGRHRPASRACDRRAGCPVHRRSRRASRR